MFCPYCWIYGLKEFYSGGTHKGCKYYLGVIHNNFHGGNIEIDHHVICSTPEDMSNQFAFHHLTTPVSGTPREVIDNATTTREKIYLNGLGMTKVNMEVNP